MSEHAYELAYNELLSKYRALNDRRLVSISRLRSSEQEKARLTDENNALVVKNKELEDRSLPGIYSCVQEEQMSIENETISDAISYINDSPIKEELIDLFLDDVGRPRPGRRPG